MNKQSRFHQIREKIKKLYVGGPSIFLNTAGERRMACMIAAALDKQITTRKRDGKYVVIAL